MILQNPRRKEIRLCWQQLNEMAVEVTYFFSNFSTNKTIDQNSKHETFSQPNKSS
jgi:hypothetical protein